MVLKLYGSSISTCTRRVLATLEELGLAYELIPVDLFKGEQKQPSHLARQPFGKIPVLDDDGHLFYESRAIQRYLAHKYDKDHKLVPQDHAAYGLYEQWAFVESGEFDSQIAPLTYELVFKKMRQLQPDEARVASLKESLGKVVDILDAHLAKNKYFAGEQFTLVDIAFLPYTQYIIESGSGDVLLSKPHFAEYWKRISSRPSWQKNYFNKINLQHVTFDKIYTKPQITVWYSTY